MFLFKSIETSDTTVCSDFSSLIVQNIKERVLLQNTTTEQETTQIFLKNMSISDKTIQQLEKATKGQSENELWCEIHHGRLTASNHHNIYTKMNCFKINWSYKTKNNPLVAQIIFGGPNLKIQNEQVAL